MFARSLAAAAILFATAVCAAPDSPLRLKTWDAKTDGSPVTYTLGSYRLTFHAEGRKGEPATPVLTVQAPGLAPVTVKGQAGLENASAEFGAVTLDPKSMHPQILFSSYSGGAHCCFHPLVLEQVNGQWKTIDLGSWDGGGLGFLPRDIDGDGTPDIVMVDNAFLYAFDCYACSRAPPLVLNIVGGKMTDVSKAPRYRTLYRDDMVDAKEGCAEHYNGVCAGYVADAARVGKTAYDAAWAFMLAHYNRKAAWDYPGRCDVPRDAEGRCKGHETKPKDFPQSLSWFLADRGYVPA